MDIKDIYPRLNFFSDPSSNFSHFVVFLFVFKIALIL